MTFRPEFFEALDCWQRGWREDQAKRNKLGLELQRESLLLDDSFRMVSEPCFRKRFLLQGEYQDILIRNCKFEGITSWTTDLGFAEFFKGKFREDSKHAAVFEHIPSRSEVILNINQLWNSKEFVSQFERIKAIDPKSFMAISKLKDIQKEVILNAPLKGTEIIAITGVSSSFDRLCDQAGIPVEDRPTEYKRLIDSGQFIEELRFVRGESARNGVKRTIELFRARHRC